MSLIEFFPLPFFRLTRNIIHGSDSVDSANDEIKLWFGEDICQYEAHMKPWIYE